MTDDALEAAKDRAWKQVAEVDAAHARGELDDAGWHRAMADLVVPAYLAGDVRRGSGHSGTAADWEYSRGIVADLVDRDGTFLDIGCANGLLMESVARWAAAKHVAIEPYGLDISPELATLARTRLPRWAERIFVGNALGWAPPRRFTYVRTGLEYVPRPRRRDLVAWLLDEVAEPVGTVIVGKFNEELDDRATERQLHEWGFAIDRTVEKPHRSEARLVYRAIAIRRD